MVGVEISWAIINERVRLLRLNPREPSLTVAVALVLLLRLPPAPAKPLTVNVRLSTSASNAVMFPSLMFSVCLVRSNVPAITRNPETSSATSPETARFTVLSIFKSGSSAPPPLVVAVSQSRRPVVPDTSFSMTEPDAVRLTSLDIPTMPASVREAARPTY